MDSAGWTIAVIGILIAAAIALNISRKKNKATGDDRADD